MDNLKSKLNNQEVTIGIMLSELYVPNITRIIAGCGYDFLLVDCEHGYFDMTQVANLVTAANSVGLPILVRVTQPSRTNITKYLDMGVTGILLSDVSGHDDALKLVDICKYAPVGNRGLSTFRAHTGYSKGNLLDIMAEANRNTIVICQIESPDIVEQIDSITSIPGVDGVLIGPNDLSQHMKITGQYEHPLIRRAISQVADSARKNGKWSGIITTNNGLLEYSASAGMTCFSVGSELNALFDGAQKQRKTAEEHIRTEEKKNA